MYTTTAEEINARFKSIVRNLMDEHGKFTVPDDLLNDARENMRREFAAFYAAQHGTRSPDEPIVRRRRKSKGELLGEWLNTKIGQIVTPVEMGDACEGSKATGHAFINANRSMFSKVSPGRYEVLDVAELRRLAGRPAVKSRVAAVEPDLAETERALNQVMGHATQDDWSWM